MGIALHARQVSTRQIREIGLATSVEVASTRTKLQQYPKRLVLSDQRIQIQTSNHLRAGARLDSLGMTTLDALRVKKIHIKMRLGL